MTRREVSNTPFVKGDQVVLTENTYLDSQGSHAVFLRFRADPNWADITTRTGAVHSYAVAWLAHAGAAQHPALSTD